MLCLSRCGSVQAGVGQTCWGAGKQIIWTNTGQCLSLFTGPDLYTSTDIAIDSSKPELDSKACPNTLTTQEIFKLGH